MGPHAAQLAAQAHLGVTQSLRAALEKRARSSSARPGRLQAPTLQAARPQVGSSLPPLRRLLEVKAYYQLLVLHGDENSSVPQCDY
eukprot:scaffold63452_cov65-Phaeocystis_antarctica.AAC.5